MNTTEILKSCGSIKFEKHYLFQIRTNPRAIVMELLAYFERRNP